MEESVRQALETQHGLRLGRRLGRGGFAEVYAAETADGGIPCAIKVSLDRLDGNNQAVQKELDNLRLLRNLTGHPQVATLMDVWLIDGYLVTRWELASGSLLDVLKDYQRRGEAGIPPRELRRYIWEAAKGIDFLNGQGVYHRDIKPANLLVFHGHVKLGDLGLAKLAGASTVSHTGAGTLGYLPPEAYGEHRLTATVDVYSLAATYVKLRTGREPFGQTPVEVIRRQEAGRPVLEGLTTAEAKAVRQALAPRPEDRPQQGACAWVKRLYQVAGGKGQVAGPPRTDRGLSPPATQPKAAERLPPPKQPMVPAGHTAGVNTAQYSPDGRRIVTASWDNTARVWDAATGQVLLTLRHRWWIFTSSVSSASYSPDGRRIVTASGDGTTRVWDATSGQKIVRLLATENGHWAAVTPQGYCGK